MLDGSSQVYVNRSEDFSENLKTMSFLNQQLLKLMENLHENRNCERYLSTIIHNISLTLSNIGSAYSNERIPEFENTIDQIKLTVNTMLQLYFIKNSKIADQKNNQKTIQKLNLLTEFQNELEKENSQKTLNLKKSQKELFLENAMSLKNEVDTDKVGIVHGSSQRGHFEFGVYTSENKVFKPERADEIVLHQTQEKAKKILSKIENGFPASVVLKNIVDPYLLFEITSLIESSMLEDIEKNKLDMSKILNFGQINSKSIFSNSIKVLDSMVNQLNNYSKLLENDDNLKKLNEIFQNGDNITEEFEGIKKECKSKILDLLLKMKNLSSKLNKKEICTIEKSVQTSDFMNVNSIEAKKVQESIDVEKIKKLKEKIENLKYENFRLAQQTSGTQGVGSNADLFYTVCQIPSSQNKIDMSVQEISVANSQIFGSKQNLLNIPSNNSCFGSEKEFLNNKTEIDTFMRKSVEWIYKFYKKVYNDKKRFSAKSDLLSNYTSNLLMFIKSDSLELLHKMQSKLEKDDKKNYDGENLLSRVIDFLKILNEGIIEENLIISDAIIIFQNIKPKNDRGSSFSSQKSRKSTFSRQSKKSFSKTQLLIDDEKLKRSRFSNLNKLNKSKSSECQNGMFEERNRALTFNDTKIEQNIPQDISQNVQVKKKKTISFHISEKDKIPNLGSIKNDKTNHRTNADDCFSQQKNSSNRLKKENTSDFLEKNKKEQKKMENDEVQTDNSRIKKKSVLQSKTIKKKSQRLNLEKIQTNIDEFQQNSPIYSKRFSQDVKKRDNSNFKDFSLKKKVFLLSTVKSINRLQENEHVDKAVVNKINSNQTTNGRFVKIIDECQNENLKINKIDNPAIFKLKNDISSLKNLRTERNKLLFQLTQFRCYSYSQLKKEKNMTEVEKCKNIEKSLKKKSNFRNLLEEKFHVNQKEKNTFSVKKISSNNLFSDQINLENPLNLPLKVDIGRYQNTFRSPFLKKNFYVQKILKPMNVESKFTPKNNKQDKNTFLPSFLNDLVIVSKVKSNEEEPLLISVNKNLNDLTLFPSVGEKNCKNDIRKPKSKFLIQESKTFDIDLQINLRKTII